MRIERVTTHPLVGPVATPFASAGGWIRERRVLLVEIATDDGIVGWGNGGAIDTGPVAIARVAPRLLGRDPFDVEVIWEELRRQLPVPELSAIDTALWDILGKALDRPVYQLLGGAHRTRVRAYATGLFRKEGWADPTAELVAEAVGYADAGFGAMKLKTGFGLAEDVRNVREIRRAIGDGVELYVDNNCGYDAAGSIAFGRRIEEYDVGWLEEPCDPHDVAGYAAVRGAVRIPVAGGEQLQEIHDFTALCCRRAVDVLQPDIVTAGGFTGMRRLLAIAQAHEVRFVPHCFHSGVALAATLQLLATVPKRPRTLGPLEPILEYDQTEHPLREALVRPLIRQEDGFVEIPGGPGLGVDVDRALLDRYRV